jgi:CheY-like chemotaxis protein
MGTQSLNKDQHEAIRMVFQRLCEDEGMVSLIFGHFRGDFRVLAEASDRVILGISDMGRGQWGLKPGSRVTLHLLDRGLPYEAVVDLQGHGKFHGTEACHVAMPRLLRALDTHRLAEYAPDRPVPCPFADQSNNVQDGFALAFGEDGLELAPPEATRTLGDMLRLNASTSVELRAAIGQSLALPMRVAYFGDRVWGLRIADSADKKRVSLYRQWLMEAKHHQAQRDLSRFVPGGLESARLVPRREAAHPLSLPKVLVDRDPMLLVLAGEDAFPTRLAEAVGRKFGVAALDLMKGPVLPSLAELGGGDGAWGRIKLVLIHHRQRAGTSLERCGRLIQQEKCPLPILLAGTGEEFDLKRNRAMAAGAVDYIVVEPFHILSVIRVLDDTLKLLG